MNRTVVSLTLLFATILSFSSSAFAQSDFEKFKARSPLWKALEIQQRALEKEIEARDLAVSTQLELGVTKYRDGREFLSDGDQVKDHGVLYSGEVSKYFGTGTRLALTTGVENYVQRSATDDDRNLGATRLQLSQNLWRDFFGHANRLRRRANEREFELRSLQVQLERANLLIRFGDLYWSYLASSIELKLREDSLKRWVELEKWMKGRLRRTAAELVDVKQVSATRILREMQVQTTRQNLATYRNDIDQLAEPGFVQSLGFDDTLLNKKVEGILKQTEARSLDSMILEKTAALSEQRMKAVVDSNRPDLKLILAAAKNGLGNSTGESWQDSYDNRGTYTSIGVTLSTPLEFGLLGKSNDSARLQYEADQIRQTLAAKAGKLEWTTLQGKIAENFSRIQLLEQLTKEQHERNVAERRRFMNGRSNSLQMVTADQDALDAELMYKNAAADIRKLLLRYSLFDLGNTEK